MKKFEFTLERVRGFRKLQLDAERARLEACASQIREIDEAAARLAAEKTTAVSVLHAGGSAFDYQSFSAFADFSERTRRQLASVRSRAVDAFERQKAAVTAARQKLEMLDKCRERALEEWKAEFALEQESLASELYLAATARSMRARRSAGRARFDPPPAIEPAAD